MTISFGGLATGLDTNSIITQLMNIERAPLVKMEGDKTWLNNRLSAFTEFDSKLNTFLNNIEKLGSRESYFKKLATTTDQTHFLANASNDAIPTTNYQISVESLAEVQKSYTLNGFTSKTDQVFGTGDLAITVGGDVETVTIGAADNSLEGIMKAINDADIGVTAAIINDGTATPYRLTLTGKDVATSFSVDSSGLTGGTETLGTFEISQPSAQAHIKVDGVDIYSNSNTIDEGVPGVTLTLLKPETGVSTQLSIKDNTSAATTNLNAFISGYNEVVSFVTGQSKTGEDDEAGVLSGDSGLSAIKRHLQDMLTAFSTNSGSFKALAELGLETQKNGTIKLNTTTLNKAIDSNLEGIATLLAGEEDGTGGLATQFKDYLEALTNSTNGLLAGRKENINANIGRIDERISQNEARLGQREKTLRAQFNAMEQLVSVMNAQSSFLTTQLKSLEGLWNYNR